MSVVTKGVVVKVNKSNACDHSFKSGEFATSEGVGVGSYTARGIWTLFKNEDGETQYLLPGHYDVVEAPVAVEVAVPLPVVASDEHLPTKFAYVVVNSKDDVLGATPDREAAREIKYLLGGKRKGVRIFQYAAVKEIR
jgi:hypothetical protein